MTRLGRLVAIAAVVAASTTALTTGAGADSSGDVRTPTVEGPITTGQGINLLGPNVSELGYTEEEYFFGGDAVAYKPAGKLKSNGKWHVKEGATEPFKTRMVVWKPSNAADFNGTVFVEWLNVSPGFDNPPDWLSAHNFFVREHAIYVGISAQQASVDGGEIRVDAGADTPAPGGLKAADPARYGDLEHPGDAFSYDVFTQGGVAVRGDGDGVNPLEGYDIKHVLAIGESQSAFRLTTYVNAVAPIAKVFDGYFIHSRGAQSAPFGTSEVGKPVKGMPAAVHLRSDLDVPVLNFETEGDLIVLGYTPARQKASKNYRRWEAAGTSHADTYFTLALGDATGDGAPEKEMLNPANATGGRLNCDTPNNSGGQHAIVMAALSALEKWVTDGTAPPQSPQIKTKGKKFEVVRDEHGIAEGGIRTPLVDVPVATNDGEEGSGQTFCRLFGHMKPFDAATLAELYPNGSEDYVKAFDESADKTVSAGYWLQEEADKYEAAAREISFG
jgi:hypothetical protein